MIGQRPSAGLPRHRRGAFLGPLLLAVAGVLATAAGDPGGSSPAAPPRVMSLELADAIQPVTAQFVVDALHRAERERCGLVILKLDTPGGLMTSTQILVKAITSSPVPVVVFVSGTQAASAGFFITLAADVAVMAPGTRFGAAHPVSLIGAERKKGETATMDEKVENDAAAWIRSLAENRKRNVALAEEAVRKSRAFTEKEALQGGLIDFVLPDEASILKALDGKPVRRFQGESTVLHLTAARITKVRMSARERFLSWLANPTILIFLLAVGAVGLYVEFTHPGMILPGVAGAVSLLCFAYATQILPINYAGLILILLGILFFILEIKVTSHGVLTAGGIVCLFLGGMMLFRRPEAEGLEVPLWTVGSLSLAAALLMAFLTQRVIWAHRQRVITGGEGLRGEIGEAVTDLKPLGRVFVHGETWNARSATPVSRGGRVKVIRVVGMMLEVEEVRG